MIAFRSPAGIPATGLLARWILTVLICFGAALLSSLPTRAQNYNAVVNAGPADPYLDSRTGQPANHFVWDLGVGQSAQQPYIDAHAVPPCDSQGWSVQSSPTPVAWDPATPSTPGHADHVSVTHCSIVGGHPPDIYYNEAIVTVYTCGPWTRWITWGINKDPGGNGGAGACAQGYYWMPPLFPPPAGKCPTCNGGMVIGDPVDVGTGHMYLKEDDYVGADPRLSYSRSYNAVFGSGLTTGVGIGWTGHPDSKHILNMDAGLPKSQYVQVSSVYNNASDACTQGFAEIQGGNGNSAMADPKWAGMTASYDGNGNCNLSNGQSSPVLGTGQSIGLLTSPDVAQRLVTVRLADGRRYFTYCFHGNCKAKGIHQGFSMSVDASGYKIVDQEGSTEQYDSLGFLQTKTWKDGYQQTFTYQSDNYYTAAYDGGVPVSITDNRGRSITFGYDANNQLQTLSTPDGSITYHHDSHGRLTAVDNATGTRTYHYDDTANPNAITSLSDEKNKTIATWTYDQYARATSSAGANGTNAFAMTFNTGSTNVIDPLGQVRTFNFQSSLGFAQVTGISGPVCGWCGLGATTTFDGVGLMASSTDWNGKVTAYSFDDTSGVMTNLVEAQGTSDQRTTHIDWDTSLFNPTQMTVANAGSTVLAKTNWTYNARGEPLTITRTDPQATTNTRTWTATYCEAADVTAGTCPIVGLLIAIDGPRTDVSDSTTYTYYASDDSGCPIYCNHRKGDLWKVTNALGHVTTFTKYDKSGRLLSKTDPNGVVTDYTYSARGWLTEVAVRGTNDNVTTDDVITDYGYDNAGQLTRVTQPDGSYYAMTYDDAHRPTDIAWKDASNNLAASVHYTLDAAGNRTQEDTFDASSPTVPKRSLKRTFNALGQLVTTLNADHTTVNGTYGYDTNGNPNSVTNGRGYLTTYQFDALNRATQIAQDPGDPQQGHVAAYTSLTLDALDRTTQVNDPHNLPTTYQYDGLDNLKQLASPDTGTAYSSYDAAGNQTSRTDGRNVTATYTYDALNRLTGIVYPTTALNVSIGYDTLESNCPTQDTFVIGRMTHYTDGSGTTQFCYDRFGRQVRKVVYVQTAMYTIADNSYDKMGRPLQITEPRGTQVFYTRDGVGRITGVNYQLSSQPSQHVLVSNVTYYPFGPVASITYGTGVGARTVTYTYDADYVIGGVHDPASGGLNLTFLRDTIGNLTRATSGTASSNFGYDPLDRLNRVGDALNSDAQLAKFTYDATGNRLTKQGTSASPVSNYTYPSTSHRLLATGPTGNTIARGYDAMGNTTSIGGLNFTYDDTGRMSVVKNGSTQLRQYSYNARGERTRKSHTGFVNDTQKMIYDEDGHLLGDFDNGNNILDEYIWMDDRPVGVVVGTTTTVDYVESDHLGTPRAVIDPTPNTAVWSWALTGDPFGEATPNQDPDADGNSFTFNLRFPGQTYDAESGLVNNYRRDYDSGIGRFIQSDELGLFADVSTYSYVGSSPLGWTDRTGLYPGDLFGGATPQQAMDAAARDAANYARSLPASDSFEVGGWIYPAGMQPNGVPYYTYNVGPRGTPSKTPFLDQVDWIRRHWHKLMTGCLGPPAEAGWHIHPWDRPRLGPKAAWSPQNDFSPEDEQWTIDHHVPMYLGTPSLQVLEHFPGVETPRVVR